VTVSPLAGGGIMSSPAIIPEMREHCDDSQAEQNAASFPASANPVQCGGPDGSAATTRNCGACSELRGRLRSASNIHRPNPADKSEIFSCPLLVGIDGRPRLELRGTRPRWSGQIERCEEAHPMAKRPPRRSSCVAAPIVSGHRGPAGERHRVSQADGVCGIGKSRNPTCEIPPVQCACSAGGERSARSRLRLSSAHRALPDRLRTGSHISRPTTSDAGIFPYVAPGQLIVSTLSDRSVPGRRQFC
jgi:hypothetical protein